MTGKPQRDGRQLNRTSGTSELPTVSSSTFGYPPFGVIGWLGLSSIAALIAIFTWPFLGSVPAPGADPSWAAGLNMAADARLNFGSEIVFTYGPLGFLSQPQVSFTGTAVSGAIYLVVIQMAFAFTLLWAARRSFPLPIAVLLAFLAVMLAPAEEQLVPIAFVWCAVALGPSPPEFARPLLLYGGALASAFALLFKLNVGATVLLLCVVAVVALEADRRRNLLTFAGTALGALTILWFAAGQGIGNIPDYASTAIEMASGHSQAMAIEFPAVSWYRVAAGLEILAAIGAAAYVGLRLPRSRLVGLVAIVVIFFFAELKSGLVRNDLGHVARFFASAWVPWLAFRWTGLERVVALGAICLAGALYFPLTDRRPEDVISPLDRADAAVTQLRTLLFPGERTQARQDAREQLRAGYRLDRKSLALVRGEGVAVYPWETSMVWAYGLEWHPLPVFHPYLAYTSELDQLNADVLESGDGPSRIIRHPGYPDYSSSIDDRYLTFEAPAQTLAIFCNYEPLRTTSGAQVLAEAENRCGDPMPLESVTAEYGQPIRVPRPPGSDWFVAARIDGIEPQGIEQLRTLLYRSAVRSVIINEEGEKGEGKFRLVPGTADDLGLILSAPPAVDFPAPFSLSPQAHRIVFEKPSEALSPSGDLQVEFFAIRATPFESPTQSN